MSSTREQSGQTLVPPQISVVVPCYNEAEVITLLGSRLNDSLQRLGESWEVILVDDGSTDTTYHRLCEMHRRDDRFKAIALSRNFGHQVAICAGLTAAAGDFVAVMDADLQDPPELLSTALNLLQKGYDVVYAVRRKRKESLGKRVAYRFFYRILRKLAEVDIPLDSGDFCVMNRRVVDVLIALRERTQFVRGLRAWTGFRQVGLEYDRERRAAGQTKYSFQKLIRLAVNGIFSFSLGPLRTSIYLGAATLAFSLGAAGFILIWRVAGFRFMGHIATDLPGWTAVILAVILFSGVQLTILGVMGVYLGMVFDEVKRRPRWVTRETLGLSLLQATDRANSSDES